MPRRPLSVKQVDRIREVGIHWIDRNLFLQITDSGSYSWVLRFTINGRTRHMGLGSTSVHSLAEARDRAHEARKLIANGVDPIDARRDAKAKATLEAAKSITFEQASQQFIAAHRTTWRSEKHAKQVAASIKRHVNPRIGKRPVAEVDTDDVMKVLKRLWFQRPETASRIRSRIEAILDWATVEGLRAGENPARWKGHLSVLLPSKKKVRKVQHREALPWLELPALMRELRAREGVSARALEFTLLTVVRTDAIRRARWEEIDIEARMWTVPPERVKGWDQGFRIPLSDAALNVLRHQPRVKGNPHVFPGAKAKRPISNNAMLKLIKDMRPAPDGTASPTVHGTSRSGFKDWCAEATAAPEYVAEMCLGHVIASDVERAYRRGDLFDKRRQLMSDWAAYLGGDA